MCPCAPVLTRNEVIRTRMSAAMGIVARSSITGRPTTPGPRRGALLQDAEEFRAPAAGRSRATEEILAELG